MIDRIPSVSASSNHASSAQAQRTRSDLTRDLTSEVVVALFGTVMGAIISFILVNKLQSVAEWISTTGIHGYPIRFTIFLAILCLCPAPGAASPSLNDHVRALVFGLIRGIGIGLCVLLILPNYGDLWNRSHEHSIALVALVLIGFFRPFGLLTIPLRGVLALVLRGQSTFAARAQEHLCASIELFHSDSNSGDKTSMQIIVSDSNSGVKKSMQIIVYAFGHVRQSLSPLLGTLRVPSSIERAFEHRTNQLARQLASIEVDRDEKVLTHGFRSLKAELRLGKLQPADEIDAQVAFRIERVAELILLHTQQHSRNNKLVHETVNLLHELINESPQRPTNGLKILDAVQKAEDHAQAQSIIAATFGSNRSNDEHTQLLYGLARALLARKLNEWKMYGWAEGLGVLAREELAKHDATSPTLALLGNAAAQAMESQSTLLSGGSDDPEARRIRKSGAELAVSSGDVRLFKRIVQSEDPISKRPEPRNVLSTFRAFVTGRFMRVVPRPLGGTDGPLPLFSPMAPLIAIVFLLIIWVASVITTKFVTLATTVPQITDPFRPARVSLADRLVYCATTIADSGEVFLGTDLGLHIFQPETFAHVTEIAGPNGPQGEVTALVPTASGMLLATTGQSPSGLDVRHANGIWKTLIQNGSAVSKKTNAIIGMLRTDPSNVMLVTTDGLLAYNESTRHLEELAVKNWPQSKLLAVETFNDALFVATESGMFIGERSGNGYSFAALPKAPLPGTPVELATREDAVLIRTDKNALLEFNPLARDPWTIVAGGEQFNDMSAERIIHARLHPENDTLLIVSREESGDRVSIRLPGTRHWATRLTPGFRAGDMQPLLSPSGAIALICDRDGNLYSFYTTGELGLIQRKLLEGFRIVSMASEESDFLLVANRKDRQEVRSSSWERIINFAYAHQEDASWNELAIDRIRTIRPLGLHGEIASIGISRTGAIYFADKNAGLVEYDLHKRSAIGERYQLLDTSDIAVEKPRSISISGASCIVTLHTGAVNEYRLPGGASGSESIAFQGSLGLLPIQRMQRHKSRNSSNSIAAAWDTENGFEIIDSSGEGWLYGLASGWERIPADQALLRPETVTPMSNGIMVALDSNNQLQYRSKQGWLVLGLQKYARVIPSSVGLACLRDDNAIVHIDATGRDEIPRERELRTTRPTNSKLALPIRDATGIEVDGAQLILVADSNGLIAYEVGTRLWIRKANCDSGFLRIEHSQGNYFAEDGQNRLWHFNPRTQVAKTILDSVQSWTTTGNGKVAAILQDGSIVRADANTIDPIFTPRFSVTSQSGTSVTCVENMLVVLDDGKLYRATADGHVHIIKLPDNMSQPTELAAVGEFLVTRAEDQLWKKASRGTWEKSTTECSRLVELPDGVLVIHPNLGCTLIRSNGQEQVLLHGSQESRVGTIEKSSRMLLVNNALWLTSGDSIVRWEAGGRGGRIDGLPGNKFLQQVEDKTYAYSQTGLWQLSAQKSSGWPRQALRYSGRVESLLPSRNALKIFDGTSILGKNGDWETYAFDRGPLLDSPLVDAISTSDPETLMLLGRSGSLLEYDTVRRQTTLFSQGDYNFSNATLQALSRGFLVAGENRNTTSLVAVTGVVRRSLDDVTSFGRDGDRVLAVDKHGDVHSLGDDYLWNMITRSRPETTTTITKAASLDASNMLLLTDDKRLLRHAPAGPRTSHVLSNVQAVVPELDPSHLLIEHSTGSTNNVSRFHNGAVAKTWQNARINQTLQGPLIFHAEVMMVLRPDNSSVWNKLDSRWLGARPIALVATQTGDSAFVLDEIGDLWSISTDARQPKFIAQQVVQGPATQASLHRFRDGTPVIIEPIRIAFPTMAQARSIPLANTKAVLPLDNGGVAWIDPRTRRIIVDGAVVANPEQTLANNNEAFVGIERSNALIFETPFLTFYADEDHGIIVESNGALTRTRGFPLGTIQRAVAIRDESVRTTVAAESINNRWTILSSTKGLVDVGSPPLEFSRPQFTRGGILVAIKDDQSSIAMLDLADSRSPSWSIPKLRISLPFQPVQLWEVPGETITAVAKARTGSIWVRDKAFRWVKVDVVNSNGASVEIFRRKRSKENKSTIVIRLHRLSTFEFHQLSGVAIVQSLEFYPGQALFYPPLQDAPADAPWEHELNAVRVLGGKVVLTDADNPTDLDRQAVSAFDLTSYIPCTKTDLNKNRTLACDDPIRFHLQDQEVRATQGEHTLSAADFIDGYFGSTTRFATREVSPLALPSPILDDGVWCDLPVPSRPRVVKFRLDDGRLKDYCPVELNRGAGSKVHAKYRDGTNRPLSIPQAQPPLDPSFRLTNNVIGMRVGDDWEVYFENMGQPVPILDLPKNAPNSIAADLDRRVFLIDKSNRVWAHDRDGKRHSLFSGRRLSNPTFGIALNKDGSHSIGLRDPSGSWVFDGAEPKFSSWRPAPSRLQSSFQCDEIHVQNQTRRSTFDVRVDKKMIDVHLRGDRFSHQIPIAISREPGGWFATVQLGSTKPRRIARHFDFANGRTIGPLLDARPQHPPPARQVMATGLGTATVASPNLIFNVATIGATEKIYWNPAIERFDLDTPVSMAAASEFYCWTTPQGRALIAPTNLHSTTLALAGTRGRAVAVRATETGFHVKLASGDVLSIDPKTKLTSNINPNDSLFSVTQSRWSAHGINSANIAPFDNENQFQMTIGGEPRLARWQASDGCFDFEVLPSIPLPVPTDNSIAQSTANGYLRLTTRGGSYFLDQAGVFVESKNTTSFSTPTALRKTSDNSLAVDATEFTQTRAAITLNDAKLFHGNGSAESPALIEWNVINGRLPHCRFTTLARPNGMPAGSFLTFAGNNIVTVGSDNELSPPTSVIESTGAAPQASREHASGAVLAHIGKHFMVWSNDAWASSDSESWTDRWLNRYRTEEQPFAVSSLQISRGTNSSTSELSGVDWHMVASDDSAVTLGITPQGFEADSCLNIGSRGSVLLAKLNNRLLLIRGDESCLLAQFGEQVQPELQWETLATSNGRRALGLSAKAATFAIHDSGLSTVEILRDSYRFSRFQSYDSDGNFARVKFAFHVPKPDTSPNQTVTWHRSADSSDDVELRESKGQFAHDIVQSVALFEAENEQPLIVGTSLGSLWLRDAATNALIDVLYVNTTPTKHLTTLPPTSHWVEQPDGWRQVMVDTNTRRLLQIGEPVGQVSTGLRTADWDVEWEQEAVFLDRNRERLELDPDDWWLPGDQVFAAVDFSPGILVASNMGIRIDATLADNGDPIVRASAHNPFVSARIQRRPDGVFILADTRNSTVAIKAMNSTAKKVPTPNSPSHWIGQSLELRQLQPHISSLWAKAIGGAAESPFTIELGFDGGCLEVDSVVSLGSRLGIPLALSPLGLLQDGGRRSGLYSIQNAAAAERFTTEGILALHSDTSSPVLISNESIRPLDISGAVPRIGEPINAPRINPISVLFDDTAWRLTFDPYNGTRSLFVERHKLTLQAENLFRGGRFAFDEIVATGASPDGAWLRTHLTHERLRQGTLETIVRWPFTLGSQMRPTPDLVASHIEALDPRSNPTGMVESAALRFLSTTSSAQAFSNAATAAHNNNAFLTKDGCWIVTPDDNSPLRWVRPQPKWHE